MKPDWRHLIKKWRNQLLNTKKILLMGKNLVIMKHLMEIYETYKLESGLWKSDVFVRDKQNVDAAKQLFRQYVIVLLSRTLIPLEAWGRNCPLVPVCYVVIPIIKSVWATERSLHGLL